MDLKYLTIAGWSMECSLMVSIAAFGPGVPVLNPGLFAVSNTNKKLRFNT